MLAKILIFRSFICCVLDEDVLLQLLADFGDVRKEEVDGDTPTDQASLHGQQRLLL
jgi:hypothetical protein